MEALHDLPSDATVDDVIERLIVLSIAFARFPNPAGWRQNEMIPDPRSHCWLIPCGLPPAQRHPGESEFAGLGADRDVFARVQLDRKCHIEIAGLRQRDRA